MRKRCIGYIYDITNHTHEINDRWFYIPGDFVSHAMLLGGDKEPKTKNKIDLDVVRIFTTRGITWNIWKVYILYFSKKKTAGWDDMYIVK